MDAESSQVFRIGVVDSSHDHAEDRKDINADDGGREQKAVQVEGLRSGDGQFGDLEETDDSTDDGEAQDDHLGGVGDPEHLGLEFVLVLHDEEDDEDDDAAHQTKEAQEESLGG